jgi:L-malate glycosyltransferase
MRIGISCYPTIGGSGAVATELGKALADRGHQVHFIVSDIPFRLGTYHQNIYIHEMDTMTYPVLRTPPHDFTLAALMADIISQYDLDILHTHYALPFAVCGFLAKSMLQNHRVKLVTTLHGTDVTVLAQDKSLYRVIKLGIEQSDAVTAVSHSLVQQTKELFKVQRDIECVHNFIDGDLFHPETAPKLRSCFAARGERVLLHISNFRKVKRLPDLIAVFKRVVETMPAQLLLVGEGPELNTVRELVSHYGLNDRVHFLGKQDDVAPLLASADLFLLPSEKESFGLVALEAMACGVPVIGSNAGGIPEVVVHGQTGYIASVGDVETMAQYAIQLLTDSSLYNQVSQQARKRAIGTFSLAEKVEEYERIYERLACDVPSSGTAASC